MNTTKEKILAVALRLFSRSGYEGVSVSDIASEIGISKGALYRHYESKRDVFDCIVKRMYEIDAERAEKYGLPKEKREVNPDGYADATLKAVEEFTLAQFTFWTEDPFASDFRKMLTLEQYRNKEMAKLYDGCIVSGPVSYMKDVFFEMIKKGVLNESEPEQLAVEFFAPLFLLINMSDHAPDREKSLKLLKNHVRRFILENANPKYE